MIGGLLRKELAASKTSRLWLQQALLSGRAKSVSDELVDRETEQLAVEDSCTSNDQHVLALALISGARLLYSRDRSLVRDFTDPALLKKPRGKVYPENQGAGCRRWLLRQSNLCAT